MRKLLLVGALILNAGLINSALANILTLNTTIDVDKIELLNNTANKNSIQKSDPTLTFYDSSRMKNLANSLKKAAPGDKIKISPSNTDVIARRLLSFTTEYTVVNSSRHDDQQLAIQVKPSDSELTRTLNFEDWKQFILNDRSVSFYPSRL